MDGLDLFTSDPRHDLFLTAALIGALILLPMAGEIRRRSFDIWRLKTLFLIFILLQFSVWPVMMVAMRTSDLFSFPLTFWTSRYDDFVKGQFCVVAGLMAFYAGYYQTPGRQEAIARRRWLDRFPPIDDRGYMRLYWGSSTITVLAFAAMMASSGGVVYFVQNIDTLRTTEAQGWGVYTLPLQASQVGFALYNAHAMARGRSLRLPILATVLQLACGFVIGQRVLMIAPLVAFVLCYHFGVRPIRFTPRVTAGLLAFLAFNMWYGVFRGSGDASLSVLGQIPAEIFVIALFGRFHGGESLARIIDHTDRFGVNLGIPYVQDFLVQFTPRFLFPGKLSIAVAENVTFFPEAFSGTETGTAVPTLMGELYWAGGLLAVVVGLYLHGRVFRRVEADMARPSPVQTTVYWAFFVYALFVNETITYHFWALSFRLLVLAGLISLVRTRRVPSPFTARSEPA